MKLRNLFSLLSLLCCFTCRADQKNFNKLCEVNKCWQEQKDIDLQQLTGNLPLNEIDWIRYHLSKVENTLRARNTYHLTLTQKLNRARCLNILNQYWHSGNFPVNEDYSYRTPIFIDKHDNFCAVGYLIKETGNEHVSRMIAANTNLAYVKDMSYPELFAWAKENGFTVDELAWIQPGYPPQGLSKPVGRGVGGPVYELLADTVSDKLYVGGSYSIVDSVLAARNISYVTQSGSTYTWHAMDTGLPFPVYAITRFGSNIIAGGVPRDSFATAVSMWDGTTWRPLGRLYGGVYDLTVYRGELYAGGSFDTVLSSATTHQCLARWTGARWLPIIGPTGQARTIETVDTTLYVGGNLSLSGTYAGALKYNNRTGYSLFSNTLFNYAYDFELFKDTLYAGCRKFYLRDSVSLFMKLNGDNWEQGFPTLSYASGFLGHSYTTFATLCANKNYLNLGGDFYKSAMVGTDMLNCVELNDSKVETSRWMILNKTVNKLTYFHNDLFAGGDFDTAINGVTPLKMLHIARRDLSSLNVPTTANAAQVQLTLIPNPAEAGRPVIISGYTGSANWQLFGLQGNKLASGTLSPTTDNINLPDIPTGIYYLKVITESGAQVVSLSVR